MRAGARRVGNDSVGLRRLGSQRGHKKPLAFKLGHYHRSCNLAMIVIHYRFACCVAFAAIHSPNQATRFLLWGTKGHEETYIENHEMAGRHSDRRPLFIVSRDALPCGIVSSPSAKG